MRSVVGLIRDIGRRRGKARERAVDKALAEMKDSGEIVSFYKTNYRADKLEGIDFVVFGIEGEEISLQVKSSLTGALKHQKKFPDIPVIIIEVEDEESIKEKIRNLMSM